MCSLEHIIQSINESTYKFDTSGVVGMLGGDNAVDALETIHLHAGRRWAGWYNYPGTITVAKRFGQMANSRFWDSLFPGPNLPPAATFNLSGLSGPDYHGSYSGTKVTTKYLGYLIADACEDLPDKTLVLTKQDGFPARQTGSAATVTVITLPPIQPESDETLERIRTNASAAPRDSRKVIPVPPHGNRRIALCAIVPALISVAACILCLLGHDRICASLILLGILCSGFSSMVLGAANLKIRVPIPSQGSPPGDGVMFPKGGNIIVLKGNEADVNIITKGEFELDYPTWVVSGQKYHPIGVSCLLLMGQFLAQLLLIPRSTFFGQILYLISFVASGAYHLFVASHEREGIHRDLLLRDLAMKMKKRKLGTRTQMAVFVCLLLGEDRPNPSACKHDAVLSSIIPNDTPVWRYWRRKVLKELDHFWESERKEPGIYTPAIQAGSEYQADEDEYLSFSGTDLQLLKDLIDDAWCVFEKYSKRDDDNDEGRKDNANTRTEEKVYLLSGGSIV